MRCSCVASPGRLVLSSRQSARIVPWFFRESEPLPDLGGSDATSLHSGRPSAGALSSAVQRGSAIPAGESKRILRLRCGIGGDASRAGSTAWIPTRHAGALILARDTAPGLRNRPPALQRASPRESAVAPEVSWPLTRDRASAPQTRRGVPSGLSDSFYSVWQIPSAPRLCTALSVDQPAFDSVLMLQDDRPGMPYLRDRSGCFLNGQGLQIAPLAFLQRHSC